MGGPFGWVIGKVLNGVVDAATSGLKVIANGIMEAVGNVFVLISTAWLHIDVPNIWDGATASDTVLAVQSQVQYLTGGLAVLGLIIGGCRLAWYQRTEPARDVVQGLFVLVLVTGAGTAMLGLMTSGSDELAQSIISHATHGVDFGRAIMLMLTGGGVAAAGITAALGGPILAVLVGGFAILLGVGQIITLGFRVVVLVLMAGLLPLSAGMTTTPGGMRSFMRTVGWLIALVAYKPLAALVYFAAFRLIDTGGGFGAALLGLTMMLVAVLALPALLRLLVPAFGAMSPSPIQFTPGSTLPRGARIVRTHG
jgi:hypothetical protein